MPTDLELALTKHKYVVKPGGSPQVNITAISGLLDIDGKSAAFAGAAVKLTKEGKDHRAEWKESGERGTRVHGYMENFLLGKPIEMREDEGGYVDALEKFLVEKNPINILPPEFVVVSPKHGYGGRGDMLVKFDDQVTLCDLKSGKEYAIEHTLQLAAQRFAQLAEYDVLGCLTRSVAMPEIDRAGCLYVKDDGTYEFVEYPADAAAFRVFLDLLHAYRWTREPVIKEAANRWRTKP